MNPFLAAILAAAWATLPFTIVVLPDTQNYAESPGNSQFT